MIYCCVCVCLSVCWSVLSSFTTIAQEKDLIQESVRLDSKGLITSGAGNRSCKPLDHHISAHSAIFPWCKCHHWSEEVLRPQISFTFPFKLWNAFHGESATRLERCLMFSSIVWRSHVHSNSCWRCLHTKHAIQFGACHRCMWPLHRSSHYIPQSGWDRKEASDYW